MKAKSSLLVVLLLGLVLLFAVDALAVGVMYCRPRWGSEQYDKMWIKTVSVTVDIQDQIAVTHVDQTFRNEMDTSVEAVYIFPLPENAMITELIYWFNGKRYVADIRERQEAVADYNERVRRWLDPALLEYLGENLFRLKIAPVNAKSDVRTEITYVELLPYDFGKVSYTFLLNTVGLSPKPLQTVLVELDAKTQSSFKTFACPSHTGSPAIAVNKIAPNHYHVRFGDENFYPDKDLRIEFETVREEIHFDIYTYTPTPTDSFGTDSFYALWITPPDSIAPDAVIPKHIVFTLDVSSSMEGIRLAQAKETLHEFLDLLNPNDWFNIVIFSTNVQKFQPDLVSASPSNIQLAHQYVDQLYALGMTNINAALLESLAHSFGQESSNNLIFLTDGYPTFGETRVDSIVANVKRSNTKNVRIFSFGVGEVSKPLLIKLGQENHGYAVFITANDSIAWVVTQHFKRMTKPVMTDLSLDFGGLFEWDHYPKVLADLFYGSQVMQMGLYKNSGLFDVTLHGKIWGIDHSFKKQVFFPDTAGGHRFVPKLWAKAKIDYLLQMIEILGEQQELVDQVIELSLRFQILTPYTAFYSEPENGVADSKSHLPQGLMLYQNYPNPFNASTEIRYELPVSGHVTVAIYDIKGRLVRVLVQGVEEAGSHSIVWDGKDALGKDVPSGIYLYKLSFKDKEGRVTVITRKMGLVR